MVASVIDAMEKQDVAVTNIPSAFLEAGMDDDMFKTLEGKFADPMGLTAPEIYCKYVTTGNNGNPGLYVKL